MLIKIFFSMPISIFMTVSLFFTPRNKANSHKKLFFGGLVLRFARQEFYHLSHSPSPPHKKFNFYEPYPK
jgi:hypothetical protein